MYEEFGANVKKKKVEFKLFFPDNKRDPSQYTRGGSPRIKKIQVIGNFQSKIGGNDWDNLKAPAMVRKEHPKGWLYSCDIGELPDGFYHYKYFVTF